jgi:hypothetical protein
MFVPGVAVLSSQFVEMKEICTLLASRYKLVRKTMIDQAIQEVRQ